MKSKHAWLLAYLFFTSFLVQAQDNPALKWLNDRIGEWEAVNNSGENPAIEAYKHEFESIMGGQGVLFRSKAKIKGQGWFTAITVLWGAVEGTDTLYAVSVPAAEMKTSSRRAEGAIVDDSFNFKIFDHSEEKTLQGDFLYTGTGDEYKLHGTQILDGNKIPLTPLVFKRIK